MRRADMQHKQRHNGSLCSCRSAGAGAEQAPKPAQQLDGETSRIYTVAPTTFAQTHSPTCCQRFCLVHAVSTSAQPGQKQTPQQREPAR